MSGTCMEDKESLLEQISIFKKTFQEFLKCPYWAKKGLIDRKVDFVQFWLVNVRGIVCGNFYGLQICQQRFGRGYGVTSSQSVRDIEWAEGGH